MVIDNSIKKQDHLHATTLSAGTITSTGTLSAGTITSTGTLSTGTITSTGNILVPAGGISALNTIASDAGDIVSANGNVISNLGYIAALSGNIISPAGIVAGTNGPMAFCPANVVAASSETLTAVKNTYYAYTPHANGTTISLPTIASSVIGDYVKVICIADVANTKDFIVKGNGTEKISEGSTLFVVPEDGTRVAVLQIATDSTTKTGIRVAGTTNGDGGIGTLFDCYFNGSNWAINCTVYGQGTCAVSAAVTTIILP